MQEPGKFQIFAIDILIGVGFGLLISIAAIFIRHNPLIAILISMVYALFQIKSFWKLFQANLYVGIIGRFIVSSCVACVLGAFVWGIFFDGFNIGFIDQTIFIFLMLVCFFLTFIYAILKNFFPETQTYKKLEQTIAGLSAIGVLDKE